MVRAKPPTEAGEVHTRANATHDATGIKDGSGLATGGDPHNPEERQPGHLYGKLGCEGAIADETEDDPESKMSVCAAHTESSGPTLG